MNLTSRSRTDRLFDLVNYSVLSLVFIIVLYPLYFVIIASISDPTFVNSGQITLLPKGITFDGYARIFQDDSILNGYGNSIVYTVVGTAISLLFTLPAAYALSRKDMDGRNLIMYLVTFTMFFSGGLIPTFLLVKKLGILNSMWALILPVAVGPWNLIIARSFFQSTIPDELREAAQIDGCDDMTFFAQIVLPLSAALITILLLFYAVGYWNAYFNALIYIKDKDLYPLQLVLRNILIVNEISPDMMLDVEQASKQQAIAGLIRYGVIIVAALPLLIVYPFLQRYFVKGVMIGAVKG
ncbi:carbohydrate ABC transporter permease [Paenibacillus silviterrae]|uniref:carbohydrate ABC transporter permease n=1 Tax=Paenibacillus silviterrae TaxID=3242194 RepID=UPI002542987B|nr:carbohydrate ABC transporter permease [Paenibacillus chinjuensis]